MSLRIFVVVALVTAAGMFGCSGDDSGAHGESVAEHPRVTGADTVLQVILAEQPTPDTLMELDPDGLFALRAEGNVVVADVMIATEPTQLRGVVTGLEGLGASVRTITSSGILSATIPVHSAADAAAIAGVHRIEIGHRKQMQNDVARGSSGSNIPPSMPDDERGEGVIVGVIDSGLDWTHADFRTSDGSTRVIGLWDQADHADVRPPDGFDYGTYYTQLQIDDCLQDPAGNYCVQEDFNGHGTHVTGTAAGNGLATGEFAGVASAAHILFVKFDFEGDRNSDASVIDAVDWIFKQAGPRPVVINLSLGSGFGPHDGTTLEEQAINDLVGPGKLVVAAAGNEARTADPANIAVWGQPKHGAANFSETECSNITIDVKESTPGVENHLTFDLWYPRSERARVQITTPSGVTYPPHFDDRYEDVWTTGSKYTSFDTVDGRLRVANGGDRLRWGTDNGDHEIYIKIVNGREDMVAAGTWNICVLGTEVGRANGRYDGWHRTSSEFRSAYVEYDGVATDNRMTVIRPSSAANVISVAAYTTRMGWEYRNPLTGTSRCQNYNSGALGYYDRLYSDLDGDAAFTYDFGTDCYFEPTLGDTSEPFDNLAFFSSHGPLRNGGQKPDISAPGVGIMSTLSQARLRREVDAGGGSYINGNRVHADGQHAVLQGTSMASPNATGAVALMLAVDPTLDVDRVRSILAATARNDGAAADAPNESWGFGKLDVSAALAETGLSCSEDADCTAGSQCCSGRCRAPSGPVTCK